MTTVTIKHRVQVLDRPLKGHITRLRGKLVYIENGSFFVEGRVSNFFSWREVRKDGTLGPMKRGYWEVGQ